MFRKKILTATIWFNVCVFGLICAPASSQTNDYPSRPINLVVGFSAGGPADAVARTLAPVLGKALGATFVIENKPGADGNIAAALVAKAEPNGYTILLAPSTHAINASLYKKLTFDSLNSFKPIALIGESPNIIAVHPSVPANTLNEFIQFAKQAKPPIAYGSSSSVTQFATELLNMNTSIEMMRVPYKGAGQAIPALLSGDVQVMISSLVTMLPHTSSGRVRGLAVTSASRSPIAPNLPTVAELGIPDYSASTWYGLFAPADTPDTVVNKMSDALAQALTDGDLNAKFSSQGFIIRTVGVSPSAFKQYLKDEIAKWRRVVTATGMTVD